MAYTARPVKICYTYVNADNSTPEKDIVRRIVGKRSGLYRHSL